MADLSDMSLEKFKLWTSNALRVFLGLRKKDLSGNFDELAARAFCALEEKISVDVTAEHQQRLLLSEYHDKLKFDGKSIPDPLSSKSGWINEEGGVTNWPSVYITDISDYLNGKNPGDLMKRLLDEYKEGKAFRYYSSDWVKEIFYSDISEEDSICMLKCKVTPSQAVNNKAYDVWVVVRKDSANMSGGEILRGYCTCTAGMLGSCNHIAGMLFCVEHAVKHS